MDIKTRTMLLTDDSYLRIGLGYLLGDVTEVMPASVYSGINLLLKNCEAPCDYLIIDESAVQGVLNHYLIKNYSGSLRERNIIYLSRNRVPSKTGCYKKISMSLTIKDLKSYFSSFIQEVPLPIGSSMGQGSLLHRRKLSNKETEILFSLVNGIEPYQIAQSSGCSVKTVYAHKYNLLDKLGFKSLKHLVLFLNELRRLKNEQFM
ncbi:helix-turn-helix domain-containing protein [Serratia marcescens]|nr:helix-turn-helix domain-containing protein [Serratia marcescens]